MNSDSSSLYARAYEAGYVGGALGVVIVCLSLYVAVLLHGHGVRGRSALRLRRFI